MPSVVINEVCTRGPNGPLDEFVELRNISTVTQNIGNWQLVACTPTGGEVLLTTIPAGTVMQPKGQVGQFFLVANGDGYSKTTPHDLTYSGVAIDDLGGVELRKDEIDPVTGKGVRVDAVGFLLGLMCVETCPILPQNPADPDRCHSRDAWGTDTDANCVDFRKQLQSPCNSSC